MNNKKTKHSARLSKIQEAKRARETDESREYSTGLRNRGTLVAKVQFVLRVECITVATLPFTCCRSMQDGTVRSYMKKCIRIFRVVYPCRTKFSTLIVISKNAAFIGEHFG